MTLQVHEVLLQRAPVTRCSVIDGGANAERFSNWPAHLMHITLHSIAQSHWAAGRLGGCQQAFEANVPLRRVSKSML
jgi:hypothetical protein